MHELPEQTKKEIKNTIGYVEADNKNHFMVGANVAFFIAEKYYSPIIGKMNNDYQRLYEDFKNIYVDFITVASILKKYSGANN